MGNVVPLPRRKRLRYNQASAIRQLTLEFNLPDEVQAEIDNAIYKLTEEPNES